jgi:hypothetical protein
MEVGKVEDADGLCSRREHGDLYTAKQVHPPFDQ